MPIRHMDSASRYCRIRKRFHHPCRIFIKNYMMICGCYIPNNGYLEKWARQGVLMLNTVLTVRAHQANSHQGRGWEQFTDAIIQAVNEQDRPIVYHAVGKTGTA